MHIVTRHRDYIGSRDSDQVDTSMIKIPFLSRAESGASLQRCILMAAGRSGVSVDGVVVAMSLLFEAISDEITKGRTVRVPGFGIFVPAPIPERHRRMSRDMSPRCKPVFSPSRGLRAQVALGVGPKPENLRILKRHRSNHSNATGAQRVFTAMQALRQQVAAQLGQTGP
jgi:nucleoid DNA-binding protein